MQTPSLVLFKIEHKEEEGHFYLDAPTLPIEATVSARPRSSSF